MSTTEKLSFSGRRKSERAASPAISMVIITAVTVVLVLVAGTYANQVLQRQQAAAEFDTVQNSILAFDDAVRDIAWDRAASRSVRFTTDYGFMRLFSSTKSFEITTSGFTKTITTGVVKYLMSSNYLSLGDEYSSYILGDESPAVSSLTASLGQALVKPEGDWASIGLNYRIHVYREGPSVTVDSTSVDYVTIMVIRLNCNNSSIDGDFELVAKNVGLSTTSYGPYPVDTGTVTVVSDGIQESIDLGLEVNHQVMFNFIIADVQVST
jgi:hypothetical protein